MLRLTSLLISSGNYKELSSFYEQVFGKPADPMMGWQVGEIYLTVIDHSEISGKSQEGSRVMFNLETTDVPAEFERIKNIKGASVVKEPYQMTMEGDVPKEKEQENGLWIATLADPDGNYFQLMSPWDSQNQ